MIGCLSTTAAPSDTARRNHSTRSMYSAAAAKENHLHVCVSHDHDHETAVRNGWATQTGLGVSRGHQPWTTSSVAA